MANTSTLLVAASNLTSNIGLAPNTAMSVLCSTVTSYPVVSNYANLQPGTAYGTILASNSFSVTSLGLPLFVANANTTVANILTQARSILPNVATFSSVLQSAGTFATYSYRTYQSLNEFTDKTFDQLGINVAGHQSAVTNGIASIFGGGATTATDISTNINILASAIENFGTVYDVSKLGSLGNPSTFVQYLLDSGYDFTPPTDWQTMSADELTYYLSSIIGPVFTRVITLSKIQLPANSTVSSLGDLLDLSKVFPASALALVPGNNFAGLANMFINLGGKFKSFADIATMLRNIRIPNISYLNSYTTPVASIDTANLVSQLGSGVGPVGNPTITDIIGTVSGTVHLGNLVTVNTALASLTVNANTQTLVTSLANLATACASGNPTYITSNITAVRTAANLFNADSSVTALTSTNTAITNMQTQLALETKNLSAAGITLSSISTSGVTGILGLVNSLHDYGIDTNQLNYNQLFDGIVQTNVGGDAVLAALAEGQNINTQAQYSVPIGTKSISVR